MKKERICPVEKSGGLDNSFRKLLQNPRKILEPFITSDMTVLDLGCGPGFFTVEIAELINSGKVIAADLQEEMLEKVRQKIEGTEIQHKIALHKCQEKSIDLEEQVDFILAFYMIHEVPNQKQLFSELKSLLKPNGQIFIIEPKFHVSKKSFESMTNMATTLGFEIESSPKVFFSRAIVLKNKK